MIVDGGHTGCWLRFSARPFTWLTEDGKPVEGAFVEFLSAPAWFGNQALTDAEGRFASTVLLCRFQGSGREYGIGGRPVGYNSTPEVEYPWRGSGRYIIGW